MAFDGAGDVNVFLSPRVGFAGEPPAPHPHPPTSLLTFADMVIALDSRGTSDVHDFDNSTLDGKLKTDHTYASVSSSRVMTRSQSLRTAFCPSPSSCVDITTSTGRHNVFSQSVGKDTFTNSSPDQCHTEEPFISDDEQITAVRRQRNKRRQRSQVNSEPVCYESNSEEECDRMVKRSSSVENVQIQADIHRAECSSEWPQISKKQSPRKSCSFEEVNHESLSHRRVVHRGGSSGQLHRLVNDTLEFPCWPRKADHTYATATWDGTAASHSLFEQEMSQERESSIATFTKRPAHQKMEVTETYILPVNTSDFEKYSHQGTPTLLVQSLLDSNKCSQSTQKDDHTYVKPNSSFSSTSASLFDRGSASNFSCATFPRQKTREDHTYFHSGMSKRGSGVAGGKEWASSQSVSDLPMKRDQHLSGTSCNSADSQMQSVSTKKDHNYSTSS